MNMKKTITIGIASIIAVARWRRLQLLLATQNPKNAKMRNNSELA